MEVTMKLLTLPKNAKKSFKLLAGINRPITPHHVTKIANSVRFLGVIRPIVIARVDFLDGGKMTDYILDGQHLFNALLRLNVDIPYVVNDTIKNQTELIEAIALLNASSKSWSMQDYIIAWASISNHYHKLLRYFETYDFELSIIAAILNNRLPQTGGGMSPIIKKGQFKIIKEAENAQILDYLTDVFEVFPRQDRLKNRYVSMEYVSFLKTCKNYNHNKFMKNLKAKKDQLVLATQEEHKLIDMFTEMVK